MALMTGEQYIESIRKIPMEIYMFGKKVENPVDNPILRPSLNSVRMTYDLAQMPEYQELMTAISPETGERINRFTHIHRSTEDLRNKVKMQRLLGQKTAACFQRCVGMDAFNAEYSTTYEIVRLAEDIAGGLMVTAPGEADFRDEKLGPVIDKYLKGVSTVSTENRLRILRLIENLSLGTAAVGYRTESMHGAGSPQAQRIMISRQGNLAHKKELAKAIAHIKE